MCVDYKENALSDASCSNLKERPIETELCDIHLPYCEEDNNENSNMIWYFFLLNWILVIIYIFMYCATVRIEYIK